jgi:hypothetical protein
LPERTSVTLLLTVDQGKPFKFRIQRPDWGLDCEVTLCIVASQVSALITSPKEIGDLATLKNTVTDLVSTQVDILGYSEGRGYLTEIVAVIMSSGEQIVFPVEIAELQNAKSERPLELGDLLLKVVLNQPSELPEHAFHRQSVRYALADLRGTILSPTDTLFHAYRAVESIMQGFKEPQGEGAEKEAWEQMRMALRVDKQALMDLAEGAKAHRHGFHPYTSWDDRLSAMQFVWRIVDRFTLYIYRGFEPLPQAEFHLLKYK